MRILVVEDDADLRRQLADALTQSGYAVDLAADGEDGHFLGDTEPYDAVILDLGLPTLDSIGVRGKGLHTLQEHIYIDSLTERAKLAAGLFCRLTP